MRRELPRIESGDGAVALDHGVDALRIERARADVAPLVIRLSIYTSMRDSPIVIYQ